MNDIKPPQRWRHKENKKECKAMPWWEIVEPSIDLDALDKLQTRMKMGTLVQIGWLIEGEHGVWFGVSMEAQRHFEVIEDGNSMSKGMNNEQSEKA